MYIIERAPSGYAILRDMTARELHETKERWPEYTFERVSGARAHQWVKRGDIHSTDLWTDHTGRIRKATVDEMES